MTKRSFYEDDDYIVNKPGTITAITSELAEKESTHGNVKFIDGMIIRTTPILEKYSNLLRNLIYDKLSIFEAELNTQKSAFKNEINNLNYEINEIIKEPVLPNLIYILTLSLSGSIMVRNRNIMFRFLNPVLFGGVGLWYFMPLTFNQLGKKYNELELKYSPELNKQRIEFNKNLNIWGNELLNGIENAKGSVLQAVHDFRKTVKEKWD